jgi:hypothetical protein
MTIVGRRGFYLWALVASPLIGLTVGLFAVGSGGGVAKFAAIFGGLPALLAAAGGAVAGRTRAQIACAAVGAGAVGVLAWGLLGIWIGASGLSV